MLRQSFVLFLRSLRTLQPVTVRTARMLLTAAMLAGFASATLPVQPVRAAMTINVTTIGDNTTNDGFCSLREALSYTNGAPANLNCGPDTGTPYTINIPAGTYNIIGGELEVGSPGNRTVTINGAGAASTVINGTSTSARVFDLDPFVAGNVDVTISNVTISGGYAQAFGGGAILGGGAGDSLILSDSIITNNHTSGSNSAAGISWSPAGPVTITNTTFSNNVSGQAAGAILFTTNDGSTLSITNSTFTGNTAGAASASAGGAIVLGMPGAGTAPTFIITRNTFTGNQATNAAGAGGAIYIGSGNLTLQYNRIVGNTAGVAGSGGLAVYGGTATATENWWGCNTGPGGACNGALLSAGSLTTSPYLFLRNTASPTTINAGGASTLTASFLTDSASNPVALANLSRVIGLPVSWSATNGTLSGQQTTVQSSATATATLTNSNICANSTGSATVDNATATATLTVQCPDLTAVKTNNVGGTTTLPTGWTWTVHIANGGAGAAAFANGVALLTDTLPNSGLTYGAPAVSGASGLTGTVSCAIDGSSDLSCTASGPVQLAAGGSFDVTFTVTPGTAGPYTNPRAAGSCAVDPGSQMPETNEANNTCSNTVTVNAPPTITSANSTTFTVGSAGSFTVTTTPGYPLATTISETGALPSGVTFTDNGDGTATLAGTPGAGTGGIYPITFTAGNGILPNATQSFTLTVNQSPSFTNANNTTFTAGSPGTFTVTTNGVPNGASMVISESGALPAGVTFTDNNNGSATLSGTPGAGTGGTYPITLTASNGVSPNASQNFTLTVNQVPAITSANTTTFTETLAGTFTITTSGFPTGAGMSISEVGALPSGVTFTDNGNGTATLAGTPALGTNASYPITITAANGVLPNATQSFTLIVQGNLQITNANNTSFVVGTPGTFTVTTSGTPLPAISESGALPSGVTFTDNGNGTATLAGTPGAGTAGVYSLVITASNGVAPDATQNFTLTVNQVPAITSVDNTAFSVGSAGTFTVTTSGFPTGASMAIGEAGALPGGVTFVDNGDGTATLAGTPAAGTGGAYNLVITANNGVPPNATQNFTLTVDEDPIITSVDNTTFSVGSAGTFTVTTDGYPTVALSMTGSLPSGVTFTDNGDGTATLAGTPGVGTAADYPLTITASNGIGPDDTQNFTLHVVQVPAITSVDNAAFAIGQPNTFTVTATGFPIVALSESGALPTGVTFVDNGDNTATLSGTPATGTNGTYNLVLTAQNTSGPDATQNFILYVGDLPQVTTINSVADTGDGQILQNEHTNVAITQLLVVFSVDMNAIEAQSTSNYSLFRNGVIPVTINSITYSSLTQTATLDINGGVALPNDSYALTVKSTLHDTGGLPLPADFVRNFVIDTVGPVILANGLIGQPGISFLINNNAYSTHFTSLLVSFNKDVNNAGGGAGTDDVTNPLNYLLLQAGPNTTYETANCLAFATNGNLPLGDDTRIPTGVVTYDNNGGSGPFIATVPINGGVPLPVGDYRLFVCGTTSIVDLAGNPLNGGTDSVLDFSIFDPNAAPSNKNPATGFAPGRLTKLPEQPGDREYTALGDLWVEIPQLKVRTSITGVPLKDNTWDVTWLYDKVGWLTGTAYPTWTGNSVLTAHAYTADGLPGPFVNLRNLKYDDTIVIHLGGVRYIYAVRSNLLAGAGNTTWITRHETFNWLTLITCQQYDEKSKSYLYRRIVRAVLVKTEAEK